jgi:hypothetical protein
MKMKKNSCCVTRLLTIGALGGSLALVGAPARAQDTAPLLPAVQFGMMGTVHGEIVRLNISNFRVPDPNAPPDPCRATLFLVDAQGDTLLRADGTPVSKTVNLLPGRSTFLQIHANQFLKPDEVRLDFRPVVTVEPPADPTLPPDPCVPSLEIIVGATGQTRLVNAGVLPFGYAGNHNETLVRDR